MALPRKVVTRNAAKAIITKGEGDDLKLLLLQKKNGEREGYALPGGGQDPGESMQEAVIRECLEEVGAAVTVVRLLCVYEHKCPSDSEAGAFGMVFCGDARFVVWHMRAHTQKHTRTRERTRKCTHATLNPSLKSNRCMES
eukprot:TRINITY_DN784_c0_g1_i1.p2 TRINITY_DN784_c0_g1~~TRINITY_DN784_c0_g1_i1.p2  ORF type:complete len:141 (+),score=11.56 TRINITY_DN784_c0_g1_i1:92-514(+)